MRENEMNDLISAIDDRFISEAMPGKFKKPRRSLKKLIAAAACLVAVSAVAAGAGIGIALRLPDVDGKLERKVVCTPTDAGGKINISSTTEPTVFFECPGVIFRGNYYIAASNGYSAVGQGKILDTVPAGDKYEAEICEINGISSDYAVLLRFLPDTDGAVYVNVNYSPKTPGELFSDIGLAAAQAGVSALYHYTDDSGKTHTAMYEADDASELIKRLFSRPDVKMNDTTESADVMLTVTLPIPAIKNAAAVFFISRDGNVTVELPEYRANFEIGTLRARALARYIAKNYHGWEISAAE